MAVTGTVRYRLTQEAAQQRRELNYGLAVVPDGARVVIEVGERWPILDAWVLADLRQHADRLLIEIDGKADAVLDGIAAIRNGRDW